MWMFLGLLGSGWALPPDAPELIAPSDEASAEPRPVRLAVRVSDPDSDTLTVSFYGEPEAEPRTAFGLVVLPDTQHYTCSCNGGEPETFSAQTDWVVDQREELQIAYVAHVGDCVQNGDDVEQEWKWAQLALSSLEDPARTKLPDGIPFGVAVGNHDQSPFGDPDGTTTFYNRYLGVEHFEGRSYYGGHYGSNNDNHYMLFSAGGMSFIVLDLEYDSEADPIVLSWALGVLEAHPDHRAIVVSHSLMDTAGNFSSQGAAIYRALSEHENLFLMLGGHYPGEASRSDQRSDGSWVHTLLANYQSRSGGGDGWLRLLTFHPTEDRIDVRTTSPTLGKDETDSDSAFSLSYAMAALPAEALGSVTVDAGGIAEWTWPDLSPDQRYRWSVVVSDGSAEHSSSSWSFTTSGSTTDTASAATDTSGADTASTSPGGTGSGGTDPGGGSLDSAAPSDGEQPLSSCACASGASGAAGLGLLAPLAIAWRRRRAVGSPSAL